MDLAGGTFLVTGGAGFIGSHIVERLVSVGATVRVLDNLSTGKESNLAAVRDLIEFHEGSILDTEKLDEVMVGVDGVFHLAAVVSVVSSIQDPHHAHSVNATGAFNVFEAARRHEAKVVFSSSAAIYGEGDGPISPYGVQKYNAEQYLRSFAAVYGLESRALRYFNVFGPRQDPSSPYSGVISLFCRKALAGEDLTINGDGGNTRDFIFVEDIADANLRAMRVPGGAGEGIDIGTGQAATIRGIAQLITQVASSKSKIVHGPERVGDLRHSKAEVLPAAATIGFRAETPLFQGLMRTIGHPIEIQIAA